MTNGMRGKLLENLDFSGVLLLALSLISTSKVPDMQAKSNAVISELSSSKQLIQEQLTPKTPRSEPIDEFAFCEFELPLGNGEGKLFIEKKVACLADDERSSKLEVHLLDMD